MKEYPLLFDVERIKKVYADKAALGIKNGKALTVLDAMQLADQASNAISSQSISTCFLTARCLPESMQEQIRSRVQPPASSVQLPNERHDAQIDALIDVFINLQTCAKVASVIGATLQVQDLIGDLNLDGGSDREHVRQQLEE